MGLVGKFRRRYMVYLTFFVYYQKNCTKYKSMTYSKIKFYIILISIFFLG